MLTEAFLEDFKNKTEEKWSAISPDPTLWGFQFQQGTKWLPGLSDNQISDYQKKFDVLFPEDFILFLKHMNGLDKPEVNLNHEGKANNMGYTTKFHPYPPDETRIIKSLGYLEEEETKIVLKENFDIILDDKIKLFPLYSIRYILCSPNRQDSRVFSIYGDDIIVYGNDLENYLIEEFLRDY